MSRRSLQYRDSLKNVGREMIESVLLTRHKFAKSNGKAQLYIAEKDRRVPGVPGKTQCSMPIKSDKAARIAGNVRRHFA